MSDLTKSHQHQDLKDRTDELAVCNVCVAIGIDRERQRRRYHAAKKAARDPSNDVTITIPGEVSDVG